MIIEQFAFWVFGASALCVVGNKSDRRTLGFLGAIMFILLSLWVLYTGVSFPSGITTTFSISGDGTSVNQTSNIQYTAFTASITGMAFNNLLWLIIAGVGIYLLLYFVMMP